MHTNIDLGPALKKLSYGDVIRPMRDWFVLLAVATALVGASIAWNVWMLRSVEAGGTLGGPAEAEPFDAAPVQAVRATFDARAQEEARYRSQYRFVDPSL